MGKRYWEWPRLFDIRPEETAFLIIDMQKGFVDKGSLLEVPMARDQVATIADFARFCRSLKIPVLYSRFAYDRENNYEFYEKMAPYRGLGSSSFLPDADETKIIDALEPHPEDIVFDKFGFDCFGHSELGNILKGRGIKTLIIAGTVVNWCVDSTIRSAYHQDYNVVVVADGVSGCDSAVLTGKQWHDAEVDLFAEAFAYVRSAEDIKAEIK